jgi:hypothetical protein
VVTRYGENEPPRDEDPAQWADSVKERFGMTDPQEVMAEVDRIVDTKLGRQGSARLGTSGQGQPGNGEEGQAVVTIMEWRYEVKPGNGSWMARQYLNGVLLKSVWHETEEGARDICRAWAARQ